MSASTVVVPVRQREEPLMDPTTAARLIDTARSQIGTKESPPGSNRNPYGASLGRDGEPWCAMFVSWCFRQIGAPLPDVNGPDGLFTLCPTAVTYARAHGQVASMPEPGDVLLFDWNGDGTADHTGIFVFADLDGSYTTIEGNTSSGNDSDGGEVLQRIRWPHQVSCIWRPPIGAAVGPTPAPSPTPAPAPSPVPAPTPVPGPSLPTVAAHPGLANLPDAVVAAGSSGDRVVALQRFLAVAASLLGDLTLAPGAERGTYGPATAAAVTSWQRRVGAPADGVWGPSTYAASGRYLDRVVPTAVLKQGASGQDVVLVQRFLTRVAEVCSDPTLGPGGADGQFGGRTAGALQSLQARVGATGDGEWGPETIAKTVAFLEQDAH
jgi:peptidoglycan hydrolase-like protein with peptidoglycan-binding domain